nr:hypothetical protein [uncultured Campylobacter sp.]
MSHYGSKFSAKFYLCYAYAAFKFNIVAATLNFKISNLPFKEPSSAGVSVGGRMQEIASGAVLSQVSVHIKSYQTTSKPQTHAISNFAIEPHRTAPKLARLTNVVRLSLSKILKFHLG